MISKNKIILILIIIIACVLRFWQLGEVPPSPDWDEAALGYNAYSIKETGKDEYGISFPIILRSFDDYKPALYAYIIIPFITLFDLNIFSVRFPSAIFGILTVIAAYFLVKEMFSLGASPPRCAAGGTSNVPAAFDCGATPPRRCLIALLSAGLLALSPWHIQFSRVAFEANVGVALNVFTALFFLKGLKKPWLLLLASLLAASNLYMYQNEKVFTPLLVVALLIIFRKEIASISKKYLLLSLLLGLAIALPLVINIITAPTTLLRAKGVSVFSDQTPFLARTVERLERDRERSDMLGLVLDNRRVTYALAFVSGYLSHFDLNWLFIKGDEARHHAPNMGLLYLFEFPFMLAGIYMLIFRNFDKKTKALIFTWFLIAPIPASITSGVPHSIRTLNFLPTFQIFTAAGLIAFVMFISKIKYQIANIHIKYLIFTMYFLFFIFNFLYYLNQYFVQQNYFYSEAWQYGYKELVDYVGENQERYDKIIVSNQPHLDQSYIFFLFYLKYSPVLYQEEVKNASGGFAETHRFGKFEFRPIVWEKEKKNSKILYVGRPEDFSESAEVIKTIYFLDKKPAIKIVKG